ncbi:hypothetical protein E3A20_20240 [Planctomyces bekefii]|uniref:Uncharacterized protein n=1 Tax=Planctomyces bekefii TaxID=1653850 RepID=A0A5C6M2I8_9PLAN|nr:hypothetical protein E3A20_20240 [Planctomyces bekefii]
MVGHGFGSDDGSLLDDSTNHCIGNRFVSPGEVGGLGDFPQVDDGGESQLAAFGADSGAEDGSPGRQIGAGGIRGLGAGNFDGEQGWRQGVFALC